MLYSKAAYLQTATLEMYPEFTRRKTSISVMDLGNAANLCTHNIGAGGVTRIRATISVGLSEKRQHQRNARMFRALGMEYVR